MKAKSILKLLSGMLVTTLVAGLMAMPAAAAGSNYTTVDAQNTSFDKYLLVEKDEKAPSVTFNYAITPGAAIAATENTLQVYAGVGTPTASVSFSSADAAEGTSLNDNYTTYKKTVDVSFSGITFSEPGVYRYIITENNNSGAGVIYDVDPTDPTDSTKYGDRIRTLDVYVEDDESTPEKDLIVTCYVMYNGEVKTAPPSAAAASQGTALTSATPVVSPAAPTNQAEAAGATKTDRIVNYVKTYSITFGKEVTGNQGSKDKYFKLTLTLTAPLAGEFTVDLSNADPSVISNSATTVSGNNPTKITATANTAVPTEFYLQDGQYITVSGLPEGTKYELTEAAEGYTSTEGIAVGISSLDWDATNAGNDALADPVRNTTGITADVHTGFTNSKNGIIPTGVLLKATPVIVIGLVILAGAAFFVVKNVRRKVVEAGEAEDSEE
ncbi:MAG: hypothetical protein IK020_06750 [Clostridiales bacterium]|nr:hypothetical protein [Clostridiales bacterium]